MKVSFGVKPVVQKLPADTEYSGFAPVKNCYAIQTNNNQPGNLDVALDLLAQIKFEDKDIEHVKKTFGVNLPFQNGKEAVDYIKNNNIKIKFQKLSRDDAHAQWINSHNSILINDKYKNTNQLSEIMGIASTLIHEAAHAKDKDNKTSIQEEIDCSALTALTFNVFRKNNPMLFKNNNSFVIKDGVNLYTDLFLLSNPNKLAKRIKQKYKNIPLESPQHKANKFVNNNFKNV